MEAKRFPMVLKTPVGTASRGTWIVKDDAQLAKGGRGDRGRRMASTTRCSCRMSSKASPSRRRRCSRTAGWSPRTPIARSRAAAAAAASIKESVSNPVVREHLARIGEHLRLARRAVGRLHRRPAYGHAALLRLQSAAGRADERRVRGARSGRPAAAVSRGETPAAVAGQRKRRPHAYRVAGAARLRGARGEPAERAARVLAAASPGADPMPEAGKS